MQLGDALRYSSGACDALGQPVQGKDLPEFVFCPRVELWGIFTAGAATRTSNPYGLPRRFADRKAAWISVHHLERTIYASGTRNLRNETDGCVHNLNLDVNTHKTLLHC